MEFRGPGDFQVHDRAGGVLAADGVVLAADVAGLRQIVGSSPALAAPDWRAQVAGLRTAPPFLVRRLWLDRPVRPERPAFLAVGGLPPLDNISVLERYDRQARDWADAHRRVGGRAARLRRPRRRRDGERAVAALHELYPETRQAAVVAESVLWRGRLPAVRAWATSPGGRGCAPRSAAWCWRATASASTCRWR